jgi:hypothetical protein
MLHRAEMPIAMTTIRDLAGKFRARFQTNGCRSASVKSLLRVSLAEF